jgi:hypothetical protein
VVAPSRIRSSSRTTRRPALVRSQQRRALNLNLNPSLNLSPNLSPNLSRSPSPSPRRLLSPLRPHTTGRSASRRGASER